MEESPALVKIKKMTFIMNALENGWTVKKKKDKYIFTKKNENQKKVFNDDYLWEFISVGAELQSNGASVAYTRVGNMRNPHTVLDTSGLMREVDV